MPTVFFLSGSSCGLHLRCNCFFLAATCCFHLTRCQGWTAFLDLPMEPSSPAEWWNGSSGVARVRSWRYFSSKGHVYDLHTSQRSTKTTQTSPSNHVAGVQWINIQKIQWKKVAVNGFSQNHQWFHNLPDVCTAPALGRCLSALLCVARIPDFKRVVTEPQDFSRDPRDGGARKKNVMKHIWHVILHYLWWFCKRSLEDLNRSIDWWPTPGAKSSGFADGWHQCEPEHGGGATRSRRFPLHFRDLLVLPFNFTASGSNLGWFLGQGGLKHGYSPWPVLAAEIPCSLIERWTMTSRTVVFWG